MTLGITPATPTSTSPREADGSYKFALNKDSSEEFHFSPSIRLYSLKLSIVGTQDVSNPEQARIGVVLEDEGNSMGHVVARQSITELMANPWLLIDASGEVKTVKVNFEGGGDIDVIASFNHPIPFRIDPSRITVTCVILIAVWALRPSSSLYRVSYRSHHYFTFIAIATAICLVCACGSRMSFGRIGGQYDLLARAFSSGQLFVNLDVDPRLAELSNPYDRSLRDASGITARNVGAEADDGYRWDLAYKDGRYYVYFGPLPAIILNLPWLISTGRELPLWVSVALCLGVLAFTMKALLFEMLKRWAPQCSLGYAILVYIAMIIGCWCLQAAGKPDQVTLPPAFGLVLLTLGLSLWFSATQTIRINEAKAFLGGLAIALLLATRVPMILYAPVGFGLLYLPVRRCGLKNCLRPIICALLPFVLVFLIIGLYNWARFRNPFDFGVFYNLTVADYTHQPKSALLCLLGIFAYLFQPPNLSIMHPQIHDTVITQGFNGYVYSSMVGGTLMVFPVLLFGLLVFSKSARKEMPRDASLIAFMGLAIATIVAAVDSNNGGIIQRYALDSAMGLVLAFAAVSTNLIRTRPCTTDGRQIALPTASSSCFSVLGWIFVILLLLSVAFAMYWWPWPWHVFDYVV